MSRAVVFGGGGPVGIAWESGLVAGLATRNIDLAAADRILGTSAGAVVGARLALGRAMERPVPPAPGRATRDTDTSSARLTAMLEARAAAQAFDGSPEEARAILGRFALGERTAPEESFIRSFGDLAGATWPSTFSCTTVNASTGEFVVWDASGGVDLDRAVAASCSVPGVFPPITLNGDRYIDGGIRTPLNADVVAGTDIVLAVSVIPASLLGAAMLDELAGLRSSGSLLELVEADGALLELAGGGLGLMDPARGPDAYDLGVAFSAGVADRIAAAWSHERGLPID